MAKASALDLGVLQHHGQLPGPGPFRHGHADGDPQPPQQAALADRTAMGRWGRPEELAGPALLLASEAGSYITGTVLLVDGGSLARVF